MTNHDARVILQIMSPGPEVESQIYNPNRQGSGRPRDIGTMSIVNPDGSSVDFTQVGQTVVREPLGYEQITNNTLGTVATLQHVPADATEADIQNNGSQSVRYRDDGPDPKAGEGMRIYPGDVLNYRGDLEGLKFIKEEDGVTLDISYYKGS